MRWTKNSIPSHIELVLVLAGVRQVKPLLPPFLARNSALVEQQQQAAAAHSVPLPALHLHTCVASCEAPAHRVCQSATDYSARNTDCLLGEARRRARVNR